MKKQNYSEADTYEYQDVRVSDHSLTIIAYFAVICVTNIDVYKIITGALKCKEYEHAFFGTIYPNYRSNLGDGPTRSPRVNLP